MRNFISPLPEPHPKCSGATWAGGYHVGRCIYRAFPSLQKVLLGGARLEESLVKTNKSLEFNREQTYGHQGGKGGGGMNWEIGIDIYTLLTLCIK